MRSVYPGMKARLVDGNVVSVVDVLVDPREHVPRYVVLNANGYFSPDVLAPFTSVWRVDDAVHLALTAEDLATLPRFDHYAHCRTANLCSRSAWRYGASRRAWAH